MLDADGTISPAMSADEIRKAVKAFYEPEPDENDETPEPPAEDTEPEETETPAETAKKQMLLAIGYLTDAAEYYNENNGAAEVGTITAIIDEIKSIIRDTIE